MSEYFFKIVDQRIAAGSLDEGVKQRFLHPTCVACHEAYQKKFPGKPFKIVCEGIYSDADYQKIADETGDSLHDVKEVLDTVYWAKNHYKVPDEGGNFQPFICRDYQEEILRCTAERKVDRVARGLGKTCLAWIEDIHTATTRKNFPILCLCPQKHQAEYWYDMISAAADNDQSLNAAIVGRKKAPFYQFKFANGSTLSIFTAGSKSGRQADSIRSQSPRKIRLEEQDLLNDGDYSAITPLLRRYKEVQFHGSSTPLGKRETYWEMCTKYDDYKEFYFPVMRHPDWGSQNINEEVLRRDSRTEVRYQHEFLAEFGDQEAGVFKGEYVDASRENYDIKACVFDSTKRYWMGVDWNGQGTGTRIRVIEYDPMTLKRKVVDYQMISSSRHDSVEAIKQVNRKWHCEGICVDAGDAGMEMEALKKFGHDSNHPDDRRLKDIQIIDFGASMEFNKLVPKRDKTKYIDDEQLDRRTKPFMVEGAVMCLESGLFTYPTDDKILDEQLRAYVVKTWSQHGYANTYDSGTVGDHDLDATMLALLGIELKYGINYKPRPRQHTAGSISMVSGFGGASVEVPLHDRGATIDQREATRVASGVPNRGSNMEQISRMSGRQIAIQRGSAFVVFGNRPTTGRSATGGNQAMTPGGVPSRTYGLRNPQFGREREERRRFPL